MLHEVDIIVLAKGFDTHAFFRPLELIGRDGFAANDVWRDGTRAYQTVALSGFPNFFMMPGPHSPVGNLALTTVVESQADHILGWIERWRRCEFDTIEPTAAATERFNDTRCAPRCRTRSGQPAATVGTSTKTACPEVWPLTPGEHRSMLAHPDPGQYDLRRRVAAS